MGWIGVDLDGTLAMHPHWKGFDPLRIGEPVPRMVKRVKQWLFDGKEVRIFTARACDGNPRVIEGIEKWCEVYIGQKLVVTCRKDYEMIQLWDDRCVQVIQDTGVPFGNEELDNLSLEEQQRICNSINSGPYCDQFDAKCHLCPFNYTRRDP